MLQRHRQAVLTMEGTPTVREDFPVARYIYCYYQYEVCHPTIST